MYYVIITYIKTKGSTMKSILKLLGVFAMILLVSAGCGGSDDNNGAEIQDNGLSKNINDLVPEETLNTIKNMGMPIYGGGEPPKIEGTYKISPLILANSNISSDQVGQRFSDGIVTFSNQNNDDLTIDTKITFTNTSGNGIGSFIVGSGNRFSVFVKIDGESNGQAYTSIDVYSGIISERGIENLYYAIFMIDDKGDAKGILIENGQGRVLYDSDGISERITSSGIGQKGNKILNHQDKKFLTPVTGE